MNRNSREYRSRVPSQRDYGEIPEEDKRSRSTLLIVGAVVIVVIICLCVVCAMTLVGAELYASDVLTATASAPTPTPVATDTPIPTNTPLPTDTPTVTPTPDALAHLSTDEKGYLEGFEQQSQRWSEGRAKFDSLMSDPKPDDEGWKSEIIGELTFWKDLANRARGLPGPGKFQPAQDKYLQAVGKFEMAADLAIQGINNQDVVSFDQARDEITSGDGFLSEARDLVNTLKQP